MNLQDAAQARTHTKRFLIILTAVTIILLIYTHYIWIFVTENPLYTVFFSAGYYLSHIVVLGVISLYWVICDGISRRISDLQKELTFSDITMKDKKVKQLNSKHATNMNFVYRNLFSGLTSFSSAYGPIIFVIIKSLLQYITKSF